MQQAEDFRQESRALAAVLEPLGDADFDQPTQFKGWTIADVIGHLHMFNVAAERTLQGGDAFAAFFAPIMAGLQAGRTLLQTQAPWLDGLRGRALFGEWRAGAERVADAYGAADPKQRVQWAGPEMSALSSITARQMETWAHGQEVFDALGQERIEQDRIRNIAHLGVATYGWSFANRGLAVPEPAPFVRLEAPSGAFWSWNDEQGDNAAAYKHVPIVEENPVAGFGAIAALFEHAAELTGNDSFGFELGQVSEIRRSGLIAYVGLSSPTLRDALKNIARYRRVYSDAIELDTSRLDSDGVLEWSFRIPTRVPHRQQVEFFAAGLFSTLRQSLSRQICPRRVQFRHARNTNVGEFERFFGCEVQFGAAVNALWFKPSDLSLPLATADNELYKVLTRYCQEVLRRKSSNASDLVVEVDRTIADLLALGEASQENVAKRLGMSPRTLSRRLAREGTTFFSTLEAMRKSLAVSYLRDSDLALAEVAFLLGYAGLSSFNDAFKRWMGKTPGQYRNG